MKNKSWTIFQLNLSLAVLLIFCLIFSLQACGDGSQKPDIKTEYQAILLQNGNLFFGQIAKATSSYVVVTDVYVPQSTINPETKQVTNFIIKRANVPWQPDTMYINPSSIALIESVGAESPVIKMIREEKSKVASAGK